MIKQRIRALDRIGHGRRRLRDLASAELALADETRLQEERARHAAEERFRHMLVEGARRFEMSPASRTLVQFDGERLRAEVSLTDREARCAAAEAVCAERRKRLHQRERELRTADKLLEHAHDALAELEQRAERHAVDDLVAARARHLAEETA